jgi:hypothetical protein
MLDLLEERVHGRARETSDALAMFLLKRRRPEKYGDQPRTVVSQHTATVNVSARTLRFDKLSDEGMTLTERLLQAIMTATRNDQALLEMGEEEGQ